MIANPKPTARNPWSWIPTLYFAQGLPNVLVATVSVVVYKNLSLSGAVTADDWNKPYSRQQAAFPVKSLLEYKFWPPVARVDNVFGDRNPVCSCVGMGNYS